MKSVVLLMDHRKNEHKEQCKDALLNKCRFNQQSCYLNHELTNENVQFVSMETETQMLVTEKSKKESHQDFQPGHCLPQPPWNMKEKNTTKQVILQIVTLLQTLL